MVEKAGGELVDKIVDGGILTTVSCVVGKVVSVVVCITLEVSFVSVLFSRVSVAVGWADISVVGGQYGKLFLVNNNNNNIYHLYCAFSIQ